MADIYLGPTGIESLLPPIRRVGGFDADIPQEFSKQIDKATMLNGATRYNFRSVHPRRWTLAWEAIDSTELATFLTLNAYNAPLHFQNNWESADWYDVVIVEFRHPVNLKMSCAGDSRFDVNLSLEEVVG